MKIETQLMSLKESIHSQQELIKQIGEDMAHLLKRLNHIESVLGTGISDE